MGQVFSALRSSAPPYRAAPAAPFLVRFRALWGRFRPDILGRPHKLRRHLSPLFRRAVSRKPATDPPQATKVARAPDGRLRPLGRKTQILRCHPGAIQRSFQRGALAPPPVMGSVQVWSRCFDRGRDGVRSPNAVPPGALSTATSSCRVAPGRPPLHPLRQVSFQHPSKAMAPQGGGGGVVRALRDEFSVQCGCMQATRRCPLCMGKHVFCVES